MYLETRENEKSTYPILWNTAKAILRGKWMGISAKIKKPERTQINALILCLEELEKE